MMFDRLIRFVEYHQLFLIIYMAVVKITKPFLAHLEDLVAETDYILRYEKGSFNSGYCILKSSKVVIINKFFPLEGRIHSLVEIIKVISIDISVLSDKNKELYEGLLKPLES